MSARGVSADEQCFRVAAVPGGVLLRPGDGPRPTPSVLDVGGVLHPGREAVVGQDDDDALCGEGAGEGRVEVAAALVAEAPAARRGRRRGRETPSSPAVGKRRACGCPRRRPSPRRRWRDLAHLVGLVVLTRLAGGGVLAARRFAEEQSVNRAKMGGIISSKRCLRRSGYRWHYIVSRSRKNPAPRVVRGAAADLAARRAGWGHESG